MITFACRSCGKSFMVPDEYAGRSATCKQCGGTVTVPAARAREATTVRTTLATARMAGAAGRIEAATLADPDIAVDGPPVPAVAQPVAAASAPSARPETPGSLSATSALSASAAVSPSAAPPIPTPGGTARKVPMRQRRLQADAEEIAAAFARSPFVRIVETTGTPPERYTVEYTVFGLAPGPGGNPVPRDQHRAQVQLTSEYPRSSPTCKMLTPIFHPNIDPAGICIGDHWTAGERLSDLLVRIGEMIAYQAYNIRSPLDAEAAMWADLHQSELPVDPRDLHPRGE